MVSISNALSLALIGGGILAFYKLGGASGIGSRLGGGLSTLVDSFSSSLNLNSIFPKAAAATVDNDYQTWLDSAGTGDGILDVVKNEEGKYCVGGTAENPAFCFNEDPNLAATPPAPIAEPDDATTTNTGGFIQSSTGQEQSTSWNTSSFEGVTITGSYNSQSIPNYSSTTSSHSQNNNSGGSGGNSSGGSSGGNSGGGGSSSGGGGNSGGSSGGQTGGSSGTSSRGGQGAGRSSNRGR
jgi:hypothetical protein